MLGVPIFRRSGEPSLKRFAAHDDEPDGGANMVDFSGALELYVLKRDRVPLILVPDSTGVPTVVHPQPVLYRAAYVSAGEIETEMVQARAQLGNDNCRLLAPMVCPDGPPYRTALLFSFQQEVNAPWRDESQSFHGYKLFQYKPTTTQAPWTWLDEMRAGRPGYFLTGTVGDSCLWRLFRIETDAFHRAVFTLSPVRLAAGCPSADFSALSDALLAGEIGAQYRDLCASVVAHAYRDVVTKTRNIVEGLVSARLKAAGLPASRDLFGDLQTLKKLLEDDKERDATGWTQLEYHLAHKIRLVHAQTHPTQTVKAGRSLRPEFALSVVDDLAELLTIWGYCKS